MPRSRKNLPSLASLTLLLALLPARGPAAGAPFIRGEMNGDGRVDLSDAVTILLHLFGGLPAPACRGAGDIDDGGVLDLSDGVGLLAHLFGAGPPPAPPFPLCGDDPTADLLGCAEHPHCPPQDVAPAITLWTVPYGGRPRDPFHDDRGRVWFVGQNADYAAHLDPLEGRFTRFDLPAGAGPHNLIVDGLVWYAGHGAGHIGSIDPETGRIETHPMPDPEAGDPHTLIADREGLIWFTVQRGNFVGVLTPSTKRIRLSPVPTPDCQPYGIVLDPLDRPWFCEFGSNKLALIDRETLAIREFPLPRSAARPRRLIAAPDGAIWYVDHAQGRLGRLDPGSGEAEEWLAPGGSSSRPYGMAIDHRARIWFVETGRTPNRMVGFNPASRSFFGITPIPGNEGSVRHMSFHEPERSIWFGTDTGSIGRARVE